MNEDFLTGLFDLLAVFLICAVPLCIAGIACALWMRWLERRKPSLPPPANDERDWLKQFNDDNAAIRRQ